LSGTLWSWSYCSWIYNYLCNRSLSPLSCALEPSSWRGVLDTLCDQVCQWLATGRWFSQDSSNNKTDRHHITEILLKVTSGFVWVMESWKSHGFLFCKIKAFKSHGKLYLYPPQRSCRGVYRFHHVCPSVCRQILCRTITWVVFLRIFQNFISCLLVKRGGSFSFLTIFTFAVPELLDLIWRKIGFLPYVVW
jgi:hypothetical protein